MKFTVKALLWLGVLALLGITALWLEHERLKAQLAHVKQELVAKGERLTIAELVPPMPPLASNGALDFLRAAESLTRFNPELFPQRMRIVSPGRARVSWQQEQLPDEKEPDLWPFVAAYVEENRPLLAEMREALDMPVFAHRLDFNKGFEMLLPHLAKHKGAAQPPNLAAQFDLHQQQPEQAFTNLLTAVKLAQRGTNEPLLISQLVRIAIATIAVGTTWEALEYPRWSDAQLVELQSAWESIEFLQSMVHACEMERAMNCDTFRRARENIHYLALLKTWVTA